MAKTVIRTPAVAAGATVNNVLANSKFQFADNPGETGLVMVRISVVSDVADNEFTINADKDFIAQESAAVFAGPPRQNQDPFQEFVVTAGTQMLIDLINNGGAPVDFHTLIEYQPIG